MSIPPTASRLLRWQNRHTVLTDSAVALLLLVIVCVTGFSQTSPFPLRFWAPASLAAMGLATGGLCLRRRYPMIAWAAVVIAPALEMLGARLISDINVPDLPQLLDLYMILGTPLCLVAVAMHHHARRAFATAFVSAAPIVLTERWVGYSSYEYLVFEYVVLTLFSIIGVLIGLLLKVQKTQLQEFEMRSARLALAREQSAMLAAANERSRIAREMHDVVAHSLAVMITMSDGAAAAIDRNPQMAKEALKVLAETGRTALADTRRLVGVLRDDPGASSAPSSRAAAPDRAESGGPAVGTGGLSGGPAVGPGGLSGGPGGFSADPGHLGHPGGPGGPGGPAAPPTAPARAPLSRRRRAGSASSPGTGGSIPVVRDLPVPEFAPPGTVAPAEPSEQIADLRRRATDAAADRSTGQTPTAPAPEQADLAVLVSRFQSAGVPVKYSWIGRELPDDKGLQLTLFRIAQEAMTNILRYAPTTKRVEVTVSRHAGTAVLTVDNDAAPGSRPMHGSGKGLIGMRERAAVYGGTVDAGPTSTGWRVRAVLRWDEDDEGTSPWQMPL